MTDAYEEVRRTKEYIDAQDKKTAWIGTGIVTDVRKSDRKIRVILLPELKAKSNWIRVYFLNAGPSYLTGSLPEIDTEVILFFPGANPQYAFCLAGGFPEKDDPLIDCVDDFALPIMDKYGNVILMNKAGITITSPKDISITSSGKTSVTSTGDFSINSSGKATITSSGECAISGSNVKIDGSSVKINGGTSGLVTQNSVIMSPVGICTIITASLNAFN